jgi:hypothetical protein
MYTGSLLTLLEAGVLHPRLRLLHRLNEINLTDGAWRRQ